MASLRVFFTFPDPVNEKAARAVAAVVLMEAVLLLVTGWWWLTLPLAYGFWARVLTGPRLSPLGWAAQNLIAPRLGERRPVPGPPKRFAQGIGAALATAALLLGFLAGDHRVGEVLVALFLPAAGLEALLGLCLGCRLFGLLIGLGLIPESACVECADLSGRLGLSAPPAVPRS
ncbi:DUF4395 family protein [Conexibacter sp. DBS9H8]|uniref:DUF4395 family protein n=1 Tax=Conexibacter sp. DBS9H8 TaxID=2937801 RepID=UPI00200E7549|nr:DUF4395 family protein [Conexibacter sp. DBS9H8]